MKTAELLKKMAREEAISFGHILGHFRVNENGTWTARCIACFRVASVIPAQLVTDGRGRGGKALTEPCTYEA